MTTAGMLPGTAKSPFFSLPASNPVWLTGQRINLPVRVGHVGVVDAIDPKILIQVGRRVARLGLL